MKKVAMMAVIAMITIGSSSVYASVSRQCEADNYIGKNGSMSSPYQGGSAIARLIAKWIHGCFNE